MEPQIVALGGGGFSMEAGGRMDAYLLSLCRRERPRVCFMPTASGDADHYVVRFYREFGPVSDASHISVFRRDKGPRDLREHLLSQDLIYVGGGCLLSLLAVWRAHGIDAIVREAWESGVVLCGLSAGSLCWFASGLSNYHHSARPFDGLGLLPYSNAVHYDEEPTRRADYHAALQDGMADGFGVGDGAALHFVGTELHDVIASRTTARAYRVACVGGEIVESPLTPRVLGQPVALVA